ncbi:MAG TPA: phosphoserine phosphatase SerB [Rhizomicrobium sp.]|nr:phosphoserine phosphatase SerB [Rhizomicrobium sp.]
MTERFSHVLNVIADDAPMLAEKLRGLGDAAWLSRDRAFDIAFSGDPGETLQTARKISGHDKADVNVVPAAHRRKKLLVADMDSTIISCECLDELADMAGLKPQIAAITERAMRGEIEFERALRERVGLLRGLAVSALQQTYAERVRLDPGAKALVATMKAHGARTLLVSGGFTYFTQRVAALANFDDHQANVLLDDGTALKGAIREPILGREGKLAALEKEARKLRIEMADTLAVGDGANDLAMIRRAGLGVAYHAKPVVAEAADVAIAHGDLRALLYLQGYRDDEIVEA